jgi:acyl-CoA synthetase (NDP forming)
MAVHLVVIARARVCTILSAKALMGVLDADVREARYGRPEAAAAAPVTVTLSGMAMAVDAFVMQWATMRGYTWQPPVRRAEASSGTPSRESTLMHTMRRTGVTHVTLFFRRRGRG